MVNLRRLYDVFDQVVSLRPEDRGRALDRVCGGDEALKVQVRRLLDAQDGLGHLFDTGAADRTCAEDRALGSPAPRVPPGTHLGPYRVSELIGRGGMGEVYKAVDSRLERVVAIKVLSTHITRNATARQRLETEARAAAALAHPHICTVLDIGHQGDVDFLVMEYLEGETLDARLQRGRMSLDETLECADGIAAALAAAHDAAIHHGDLKPGNVILTRGGPKLLDFGVANRTPDALRASRGGTDPLMGTGTITGTTAYMAPEQFEGHPANARTDIFSFGAVLYEMLTGRKAFPGVTHASRIGSTLRVEPPAVSLVAPNCSPALEQLVAQCLSWDPARRVDSASDLRNRLAAMRRDASVARARGSDRTWRQRAFALTLTVMTSLLVLAIGAGRSASSPQLPDERPGPVQRNLTRLTFDAGLQTEPAFSPDGRFLAYASDSAGSLDIWVQPVAGGSPVRLTTSPAVDTQPSWSPDGSTIAFRSEREGGGLYLVPAHGGPERRLTDHGIHPSWSPDGREVRFLAESFADARVRLKAVSLTGPGTPYEILPAFGASGAWRWIAGHPDGRVSFLGRHDERGLGFFTVSPHGEVTASRMLPRGESLVASEPHNLIWNDYDQRFQWKGDGTGLLLQTSTENGLKNVWMVHVDAATLAWTSVERLTTGAGMDVAATLSADGTHVAFSTQRVSVRLWQFPFVAGGTALSDGRALTDEDGRVLSSSVTRDGKVAVYTVARSGASDPAVLSVLDVESGRSAPLEPMAFFPTWSSDSREIAYAKPSIDAPGGTLMTAVAVRTLAGGERLITPWTAKSLSPGDWLPDGQTLIVSAGSLERWPAAGLPDGTPEILLHVPGAELWNGTLSANGRWLAFSIFRSAQPGRSEIGVTTLDGAPDRAWTRLAAGHRWADKPRWAADGTRLYFLANEGEFLNLWAVEFDTERGIPVGEPFPITRFTSPGFRISPAVAATDYSVSRDHAFLTMQSASGNIWMLDNLHP